MPQDDLQPTASETLLFLPGAGGNTTLWQPVSDGLSHQGGRRFFGWPGFAGAPADPNVRGLPDLVARVVDEIAGPSLLFAQSMGGLIALRAALAKPERIRAMVLSVTSGGIDVAALGGSDWRPQFEQWNPNAPRWFLDARDDLTSQLPRIAVPTLLLWGDADPISPVAVGQVLAALLPQSELVVIPGGTHDLVSERASEVLPHVEQFLEQLTPPPASANPTRG
ncbi:MAG TPA: alpha/beta hydrolase [Polyangiaceae bacterium]|nr:alpha/beta hydrolase [Polyangiaceae bacterium]